MPRIPKKLQLIGLSLLAGLLMWGGWPPSPLFPLLFIGFVPLLILEEYFSHRDRAHKVWSYFLYTYLGLLVWNALTTYWIYMATLPGAIFAILANALLMTVPLLAFHFTKKQLGEPIGYFSLILYWMSFEYIHLQWELSWSWLNLGNAFSMAPQVVQWYEYTGIFGGTLWILGLNLLIFRALRQQYIYSRKRTTEPENISLKKEQTWKLSFSIFKIAALVIIPILLSLVIFWKYETKGTPMEVVLVQPNIDPYEEKFMGSSRFIPYEQQLDRLLALSERGMTPNTKYIAWPETSIPGGLDMDRIEEFEQIQRIKEFLRQYPHVTLITGIDGYRFYTEEFRTITSRPTKRGTWYDAFNSSIQVTAGEGIQHYHKSKLVPGVERMPYPQIFSFLENFAIDLGGITGTLGTQKERTVFFNVEGYGVAPVICFESIFGDFVTDYINKGAQVIFVITNDGWWGNTEGHRQHLYFSSLRAIETRKDVARAANTGITALIDQRGIIHEPTDFWEQAVLNVEVYFNDASTFYTRNGDIIARTALLLAIISLLLAIVSSFTNKFYFRSFKK